jgi:hypothetical protein
VITEYIANDGGENSELGFQVFVVVEAKESIKCRFCMGWEKLFKRTCRCLGDEPLKRIWRYLGASLVPPLLTFY